MVLEVGLEAQSRSGSFLGFRAFEVSGLGFRGSSAQSRA